MTISYAAEVAHCTWFGSFPKLLLRWRASIFKLIWVDVLVYICIYYSLNMTYRFWMNEDQRKNFELFVRYCNSCSALIPLMFVLGFYVSIVVRRWWEQYMALPWPDSTAVYVSSLIRGHDENGRKMRRTIMRYVCLSLTMVLSMISPRVKNRFPTLDQMVDVGLLIENEKDILIKMDEKFSKYPKHWMPIVWASSIVSRGRKEGRIRDDSSLKTLIDSLNKFRGMCMVLLFYDTISIPLVYTQVVTIAVYTYFFASVIGHQWTSETDKKGLLNIVDYFFPFFTVLEYMFFMGWLKVAESLISPFGNDDDDFEVNWLIDRNLQVSYLIVDEMHSEHPELIKDQYWDQIFPTTIPYPLDNTIWKNIVEPPLHSTAKLNAQSSKKSALREHIIQSVTRFFRKHPDHDEPQTISVTENLMEINSVLKQFLSPSAVSEEMPSAGIVTENQDYKNSKETKLVQISSVMSIEKEESIKNEESEDAFEKLKKQRQLERILRQKPQFLIVNTEETQSLLSKDSKLEVSSEKSDYKENETKKDI